MRRYGDLLFSAALSTAAASGVWTAATLRLAGQGRVTLVGMLLAAELVGSFGARVAEHLRPRTRFLIGVVVYTAARAVLVPLTVTPSVWVLLLVSLLAGGAWRLLSAQFVSNAVSRGGARSRNVANMSVVTTAGALLGTMTAGYLHAADPRWWSAGALLVVLAARVATPDDAGAPRVRASRIPAPLAVTAFFATLATTSLARLAPVVVSRALSPAWVGIAAIGAAVSGLLVPLLVRRTDGWSERKLLLISMGAAGVWVLAPLGAPVLLSWAVASLTAGLVDAQLDARSATGPDPAGSVARAQSLQSMAGAGGGAMVARLLDTASTTTATLTVVGIGAVGLLTLSAMVASGVRAHRD